MMLWADEMAYIAASLTFPAASFVTKLFEQFDFKSPVTQGDIIKINSQVETVGTTSCKVAVWATHMENQNEVFRTFAVMVNSHEGRKTPLKKEINSNE
jgi:acyl-CoA hydrolase